MCVLLQSSPRSLCTEWAQCAKIITEIIVGFKSMKFETLNCKGHLD